MLANPHPDLTAVEPYLDVATLWRIAGAPVVHTRVAEDAHRVEPLLYAGDRRRLAEGAHALVHLPRLEQRVGKPVLSANQGKRWESLRIARALNCRPGLGTFFDGKA